MIAKNSEKGLRRWARITWVSAYLVVLAGSVVRMTGSGMGCPDWPKCFGLMIPPTDVEEVTWTEGEEYASGRMLIADDTLWVVMEELQASDFQQARATGLLKPYDKHDYAIFNPVHTWVEFINRLIGALTGLPALLFFFLSVRHVIFTREWRPFLAAVWTVVMLGFAAWLGKKVVDGNLIPGSITLHMLGALAILLGLLVYVANSLHRAQPLRMEVHRGLLGLAAFLALGQLIGGTQVREAVDGLSAGGMLRADWIAELPDWWKWHRTFSWGVLAVNLGWAIPLLRLPNSGRNIARVTLALLAGQFLTGVCFVYAGMPAVAQPIHLLLGMGLILANAWAMTRFSSRD